MIEVRGLVKRYGDRAVLNGVSFAVREGEIFGLLGPNGAGKTTLISILATLLPPDEGQVLICRYDLRREADRIRPLIGFVPQELALYPTLSAWDNLAFFGRIYGLRGTALSGSAGARRRAAGGLAQSGGPDGVRGGLLRPRRVAFPLRLKPPLSGAEPPGAASKRRTPRIAINPEEVSYERGRAGSDGRASPVPGL